MSQQKLELKLKGLFTSPNNLSAIPEGALEIAENVVIDKTGIIESRRGQAQYGNPLTLSTGQVNKIFNYKTSSLIHYENKLTYDSDSVGTWVDYSGTYVSPSTTLKMRSLEASGNFYFTTDQGIYKLDAVVAVPRRAGVPKALSGTYALSGGAGFMTADTAVAYRLVWGYKDINNNLILGAPSQRLIAQNTGTGTKDVTLTFIIPDTITTEYFYQIYRSFGTVTASATPDDELQLVAQGNPVAAEITAKSIVVVDTTPYSLMRATLYTSPSQEGISGANNEPNLAVDMDIFKNSVFYANTTSKQNSTVTVLSVGGGGFGYSTAISDSHSNTTLDDILKSATRVVQTLTYTAVTAGVAGNDISITYTSGGTAGAEVVTVTGSAISVQIQSGVSTGTQVKTKIDASGAAAALVTVSGASGTAQTTQTILALTGGFDTTVLRVGMRIIRTGIPTDTYILSIQSTASLTMTAAATTTTGDSTTEFQDRFSIGNVDYYAATTENHTTNSFISYQAGTPAQNIDTTATNLIQFINTDTDNTTLYGYYVSALDDLPGQMFFEERSIGGASFNINTTATSYFSPSIPNKHIITANTLASPTVVTSLAHGLTTGQSITISGSNSTPTIDGVRIVTMLTADTFSIPVNVTVAGTTGTYLNTTLMLNSVSEVKTNRVYVSKPGQPEAVPAYSYFDIGSSNFPIQRIIALRDGIFFLKADGIFRLSGETFSSFTVTLVDSTTSLKVPESAVAFNNQVFCFADQGICAITDSGVQIMSVPIEGELLQLASEQYTNFATASFGVGYESSRQYMFFTVTETTDTFATQAYVYNSLTTSWTKWIMNRTCGVVNTSSNKLLMAEADTGQILKERKSYTNDDYADKQYNVVINSIDSTYTMTLASVTTTVVGMSILQGAGLAVITEIAGNVITIDTVTAGFGAGAAVIYTPIANRIQWAPLDVENPGMLKQFSEVSFFFRNAAFQSINASFQSNLLVGVNDVPLINASLRGWGDFAWGDTEWGGNLGGAAVIRTYVPRERQRCHWLTLGLSTSQAFTGFSLQGVSLLYNSMSVRIK